MKNLPKGMTQEDSENLPTNEFVEKAKELSAIDERRKALTFLFFAYGMLLVATISIFFLQGFKFKGFNLDNSLIHWLGGATITEVAGLAALVYGSLFKKN